MTLLSPLAIAGIIVALVALAGVIATSVQRSRTFNGFEPIASEIQQLALEFRAEVLREQDDVVVSGNRGTIPFTIRFSHRDNTPGLHILCRAPVTFTLFINAWNLEPIGGRNTIRTGNARLDQRWAVRTDDPDEARVFVTLPSVHEQIEKLCCGQKTSLSLSPGSIELAELLIPDDVGRHVLQHLDSLAALSSDSAEMPGAHAITVEPIRRRRSPWIFKVALAVGVLAAVGTIISNQRRGAEELKPAPPEDTGGIAPADLRTIPDSRAWKTATPEEFDSAFSTWARAAGSEPSSKLLLGGGGEGEETGSVYFLTTKKTTGSRRVVWVAERRVLYDFVGTVAGIAKVSKDTIAGVQWTPDGAPGVQPDTNGLLVVREYDNPTGATLFFVSNGKLYSGVPADFHTLGIR